jgi:hypothetical protein
MEITRLEKAALLTAGAGASFMTLLWNLAVTVESDAAAVFWLRILFAAVSFTAFDLQLWSVVARGWSISGIAALVIISGLSGAIGLEVSGVVDWPALHAAPALALAAFGAHLMISRAATTTTAPEQPSVTNTQINIGTLPRTFADFAAARARELPDATPAQLAAALGTSESTVRRLLDRVAVVTNNAEDER